MASNLMRVEVDQVLKIRKSQVLIDHHRIKEAQRPFQCWSTVAVSDAPGVERSRYAFVYLDLDGFLACFLKRVKANNLVAGREIERDDWAAQKDRKSTRLNSSHGYISY